MMIKVTFLGTSSATPTKKRNFSSIALSHEGKVYLFDCGEGTQRQMMRFGVSPAKIDSIFITHIHGDHTLGLPGLVRTLALTRRQTPLRIYIPAGYEKMLHSIIFYDNPRIDYKLEIIGVKPGTVLTGRDFVVKAFRLKHSVGIVGYTFSEKGKIRFLADKCRKLGLRGEMYKEILKKGKIKLNGKAINLKDITFTQEGRMFAYATDTRPLPEAARAFAGADLLVHEATYESSNAHKAKEYMHSMAEEVARLAKRAKVKRLVMTHLSARYKTADPLVKEARAVFRNSEFAEDGMEITI